MRVQKTPVYGGAKNVKQVKVFAAAMLTVVGLAVAIPGMRDFLARASVSSAAAAFMEALHTARMEALARNSQVTICKSRNVNVEAPACAGSEADWTAGWVIFVDEGTSGLIDGADEVIATGHAEGGIDLAAESPGRVGSFTFSPVGPITGASGVHEIRFVASLSSGSFERVICLSILGRASTRTGSCPA
jgi:type IV fimbrial biogenesis protein FimT